MWHNVYAIGIIFKKERKDKKMSLYFYDIKGDLHTHTIFSKHAYSTIEENIRAALNRDMKFLAITDHYYNDGTDIDKKNEVVRIKYMEEYVQPHFSDIRIVSSAEFNLCQSLYDEKKLASVYWRPIGLHNWFLNSRAVNAEIVYNAFKKAVDDGFNAFVHIERELYALTQGRYHLTDDDIKELLASIVKLAKDKDIWLEVNESSIARDEDGYNEYMNFWVNEAKALNCKIYLGTDAHYAAGVGVFDKVISMLNAVDYPKDLILNCSVGWMNEVLKPR